MGLDKPSEFTNVTEAKEDAILVILQRIRNSGTGLPGEDGARHWSNLRGDDLLQYTETFVSDPILWERVPVSFEGSTSLQMTGYNRSDLKAELEALIESCR